MPKTILKLVYRRDYFDVAEMRPNAKQITTITADGLIVEKEYAPGSRKAHSSKTSQCSTAAFLALCEQLNDCIVHADRLDGYCDDASEELIIYHRYGRTQKMDRGLGTEHTNIGIIVNSFLQCYPGDNQEKH